MRKKKTARIAAVVILAAIMIFSFSTAAFAIDGESPISVPEYNDPDTGDNGSGDDPNGDPVTDTPTEPAASTDAPSDNGDGGNGYDDVIDSIEATEAPATEAPKLSDLPAVDYLDIIEATAVVLPDVEISDASLFSGLVMWLCVAVGIAVVVGVMVSKRTRRRG